MSTAEWYQVTSNSVNKNRDKKMAFKLVLELLPIITLYHKQCHNYIQISHHMIIQET